MSEGLCGVGKTTRDKKSRMLSWCSSVRPLCFRSGLLAALDLLWGDLAVRARDHLLGQLVHPSAFSSREGLSDVGGYLVV